MELVRAPSTRSCTRNIRVSYGTYSRNAMTGLRSFIVGTSLIPSNANSASRLSRKQGAQIPEAIDESLTNDLFVPEDFEDLVLEAAGNNTSVGKLLSELQEPRPAGKDCIPWLGEISMKERILRLCARGKDRNQPSRVGVPPGTAGEDEETAWKRLRPKLSYTGQHLKEVFLLLPSGCSRTAGAAPASTAEGAQSAVATVWRSNPINNPLQIRCVVAPASSGLHRSPPAGGIFGGGRPATTRRSIIQRLPR